MSRTMSRAAFRALRVRVDVVAEAIERERRWQTERFAAESVRLAEAARSESQRTAVRYAGGQARKLDVPAARNPYLSPSLRKAWADGWNEEHARMGARRAS